MTKVEMENRLVVARNWDFGEKKGGGCGYKKVVVQGYENRDCSASCGGDHTNLHLIKLHRTKHT